MSIHIPLSREPLMHIHAKTALLPGGWADDVRVGVVDGRIANVDIGVPGGVGILCAAPVNLHSHTFQRAMAGLTEHRTAGQDSFWTWRSLMYRFLERLTPDDVQAIAAQVFMEMAAAGYAGVCEFHYLHHGPGGARYDNPAEMALRVQAAADQVGLGLTLLPVFYERGGCDGRALAGGQLRFGNDLDAFARLWGAAREGLQGASADTVIGVAPHSLRAVSAQGLGAVAGLAPEAPLHLHLAEQVAEVDEVLAHTGARPVEWLLANADVDARWCAIHATQMQAHETKGLAATGAVAGQCPITEANLGDGIFDGLGWQAAGGAYGVGSDSNVRISLTEELRLLEYSQRLAHRGRAMLATDGASTGRSLFDTACAGGAQAAGRQAGAIRVGDFADLLRLDGTGDLGARRGDAILDTLIFAGDDRMVTDVWSAGRHIVADGRHAQRDAITARFRAVIGRLGDAI
jgi:formimidoylglutamate deiminase